MEAKYASEQVKEIDLLQLDNKVKVTLLRIHVITGWTIPIGEIMGILVDEFRTKLLQEYEDLNFNEILFAFRKYNGLVQDWGKEMNVKLISKVLDAYAEDRYDVGLLEERIKMNDSPTLLEFQPKEYTDEEILGIALDYWQNSPSKNIEFLNPSCYEILVKQGKVTLSMEEKERIMKHAELLMEGYFTNVIELRQMRQDENYKSMVCKKIAVSEYFNSINNENQ